MDKQKKRIDRMNSFVVDIDLGEKESVATYMAPDGDIKDQFTFPMISEGYSEFMNRIPLLQDKEVCWGSLRYSEFMNRIPLETRIAFEASGSAYVVSNALKNLGYSDITVAHLMELSWITKPKKKNDKVDSLKLAKLHLVGMSPESHLLEEEGRILRDLLIQRVKLGKSTSSLKNNIVGYLKRENLFSTLPDTNDNFCLKRITVI